MADEEIGGVSIPITADFSDLGPEMDAALSEAQAKSSAIASAITSALGNIDTQGFASALHGFIDEMGLTGDAADKLSTRITELWSSGQAADMGAALAQALKEIGDSAQAANDAIAPLTPAIAGFGDSMGTAGDAASKAGTEFQGAADNAKSAGESAHEAGGGFAEMAEKLAAIGEALAITEGLIEFGKEALAASDAVTKVSIALTSITGSAGDAEEKIKGLEKLGMSDGLSFPSLYTAGTRLQQLLGPEADVVGMLGNIADGAARMGTDIGAAATKFSTLVESGSLSVKAMRDLGLNFDMITASMNKLYPSLDATSDSAKKLFKDGLNDQGRIQILQDALSTLGGTAQKVADQTFGGQWQRLENQWEQVMAEVGKALMPAITALTDFASKVAEAVKEAVDWFNKLSQPVKDAAIDFGLVAAAIVPLAGAIGGVALALGGLASLGEVTGELLGIAGGFTGIGEALLAVAPEVAAFALAAAAIHFSGLDESVLNFFDSLRGSLTGLADLFSPITNAAGEVFAAIYHWSGLNDIVDVVWTEINGEIPMLGKLKTAAEDAGKGFSLWDLTGVGEAKRLIDGLASSLDYLSGHYKVMSDALGTNNPVLVANNKNMHDAAQAAMEAAGEFDKHTKATGGLKDATAALAPELVKLAQATHDLVDNTKAATDPMKVLAANEDAAGEKIIALTENLGHANANLITAADNMAKVAQQYKDGAVGADAYTRAQKDLATAAKAVADEMEALTTAQIHFANAISAINLNIPPANDALTKMDGTIKLLGGDMDLIPPKASPVNQAMIDFGVNAGKAKDAVQNLSTPVEQLTTDMGNLIAKAQDGGDWGPVLTALDNFDKRIQTIAKTDLPEAVKQMEAMITELQNAGAPVDLIRGQIDKLGASVEKMAQEQLPGWHDAWQNYLNDLAQFPPASAKIVENLQLQVDKNAAVLQGLINQKAAYGDILAAQGALLQSEVSLAEKTGDDANQMVTSLEAVRLKELALADAADGYGKAAAKAAQDVMAGFAQLSGAMAGAIVDGKNVGDALIGVFKNVAKSILTDLIDAALSPLKVVLENMLATLLGLPPVGAAVATAVAGSMSGVNIAAGQAALGLKALGVAASETAAQIQATGLGGAGGGSGGAGGGTLSTSSDVAGIIAAGALVAADVLLGHISSDTGHIEVNTRETHAELLNVRADAWSQFGQTYDRIGELKNDLDAIKDILIRQEQSGGGIGPVALADLDRIATGMDVLRVGFPTLLGALSTIAQDVVTWGQYIESDTGVMVGKLGQILTYIMAGNALAQAAPSAQDVASAASDISAAVGQAADQSSTDTTTATSDVTAAITDAATQTSDAVTSTTDALTGAAADTTAAVNDVVAAADGTTQAVVDSAKGISDAVTAGADHAATVMIPYLATTAQASTATVEGQARLDAANKAVQKALDDIKDATDKGDLQALQGAQAELDVANSQLATAKQLINVTSDVARTEPSWIKQQIDISTAAAKSATNTTDELKNLKNAYDGYEALLQQAIEDGDHRTVDEIKAGVQSTADTYRTAAANVLAQIQQVQGDISGAASLINEGIATQTAAAWSISAASTTAVGSSANQVVAAVNNAAVTISTAVAGIAQASFKPTGSGTTTSTTAAPPYVGPSPTAGSTPAPTGGGGFASTGPQHDTNSPANIPTTVVTAPTNVYDPTLPDPTKPKPPYVPPVNTTSPTSTYYQPPTAPASSTPATSGVPSLNPQPVGTQGTPLPPGAPTTTTAPPTPTDPAVAAAMAQLATDQAALMQALKDLGNAPNDQQATLQKQANDLLKTIADDQSALAAAQASSTPPNLKGGPVQGPSVNIPLDGGGSAVTPASSGTSAAFQQGAQNEQAALAILQKMNDQADAANLVVSAVKDANDAITKRGEAADAAAIAIRDGNAAQIAEAQKNLAAAQAVVDQTQGALSAFSSAQIQWAEMLVKVQGAKSPAAIADLYAEAADNLKESQTELKMATSDLTAAIKSGNAVAIIAAQANVDALTKGVADWQAALTAFTPQQAAAGNLTPDQTAAAGALSDVQLADSTVNSLKDKIAAAQATGNDKVAAQLEKQLSVAQANADRAETAWGKITVALQGWAQAFSDLSKAKSDADTKDLALAAEQNAEHARQQLNAAMSDLDAAVKAGDPVGATVARQQVELLKLLVQQNEGALSAFSSTQVAWAEELNKIQQAQSGSDIKDLAIEAFANFTESQKELKDATDKLAAAQKSGDKDAIAAAQKQADAVQQAVNDWTAALSAFTGDQLKSAGVTLPASGTGTGTTAATGTTDTSGSGSTYVPAEVKPDTQTLGFYAGSLAELEDIRNTTHGIYNLFASLRDALMGYAAGTTPPLQQAAISVSTGGGGGDQMTAIELAIEHSGVSLEEIDGWTAQTAQTLSDQLPAIQLEVAHAGVFLQEIDGWTASTAQSLIVISQQIAHLGTSTDGSSGAPTLKPKASFDAGGPVPFDMLAMVHQGEEVLPKDVAGTLRSMMRTPSYAGVKTPSYDNASSSPRIYNVTVPMTVIARSDPYQQAVQLTNHIKKMVPDAGAFSD